MPTNPRNLYGDIAGPGGPFDSGAVILDASNAVLLDNTEVAKIDETEDGRKAMAMLLSGRVNRAIERAQVMFLFDLDGAAAIITELHGLAERAGWQRELSELCEERWQTMEHGRGRT